MAADALIADEAFDAEERVLRPLAQAGKTAVIPPEANRKEARAYDKDLYKALTVQGVSSTLAIFRILEQIQWFSGSALEALNPCFATVFFCKWPKSS